MPQYVALVHKESDGCYGVSFPDLPGVITGGDSFDEALEEAAECWHLPLKTGSIRTVRPASSRQAPSISCAGDPEFLEEARDAVIAFVEFPAGAARGGVNALPAADAPERRCATKKQSIISSSGSNIRTNP